MKILFVHQNFPGQFIHLSRELVKRGHDVRALTINGHRVDGVVLEKYGVSYQSTKDIHPLAVDFETKVIRGQACARKMLELKSQGYTPEIIIAHPGWGEVMFCKSVFPATKLIDYLEYHYGLGEDALYDPEFSSLDIENTWKVWVKNANNLLGYADMDGAITPTHWQKDGLPVHIKNKVKVVFDGIDTDELAPNPSAFLEIKNNTGEQFNFCAGEEILTFANRNLEPYRGYHSFMRSLPKIMAERPAVKVLIVGGDDVSYGAKPPFNISWKNIFLKEVENSIDLSRVFFLGSVNRAAFTSLLQISRCHIYLTYPFVMSWSAVEAMSIGALVVGSRTAPVEEFVAHKKNGMLVNFFDYEEIANTTIDCLANPEKYDDIRNEARKSVIKKYDLKSVCLPKQVEILSQFVGKSL